ncbi:serine carboxypeptidase-like protein 26 [Tanacetum coccineum]
MLYALTILGNKGLFLSRLDTKQVYFVFLVVNEALVHNDAVANIFFIESPVGVGFSYSNTTEDYMSSGDNMTAEDMYNFLRKWFERYPVFKGRDFFMTGESYAGSTSAMEVSIWGGRLHFHKIGNGLLDDVCDTRGAVDFAWSHALVSEDTRMGLWWLVVVPVGGTIVVGDETIEYTIELMTKLMLDVGSP